MKHCNGMMVTVRPGDTLYALSQQYRVPLAALLRANPYLDVYNLQPGETVCVPVRRNDRFCDDPYHQNCPMPVAGTAAPDSMVSDPSGMDAEAGSREAEGQPWVAGVRPQEAEGQPRVTEGRTQDAEGRTQVTGVRPQEMEGQLQVTEGRTRVTEGQSREADDQAGVETASWAMGQDEARRRPGGYITRRGDTLESVLGVEEIPLMPGTRLRFPAFMQPVQPR